VQGEQCAPVNHLFLLIKCQGVFSYWRLRSREQGMGKTVHYPWSKRVISVWAGLAVVLLAPAIGSQGAVPSAAGSSAGDPTPTVLDATLSKRGAAIKKAVAKAARQADKMGGVIGIAVVDIESGELLAAHKEHEPLNPASNAKVFTAATALATLRPTHRYYTALYGKRHGSNVNHLVLRGTGDPALETQDLWRMVDVLKNSGIRKVDGDIIVDQAFFDAQVVPPAFAQQPSEWAAFRAPVSAVALNGNTVSLMIRPTAKGSAARVWFEPEGFVSSDGSVKTVSSDSSLSVRLTLQGDGQRLKGQLSGGIPENARQVQFVRRVEDPRLLAGYALLSLLKDAGISVGGKVREGSPKKRESMLAMHKSAPLSNLLFRLGKNSDNFYAEMIYKSLALEHKGRPAKFDDAADVVVNYLKDVGAYETGVVVKNGSGLFDANRVTTLSMAKLLRVSYRDQ
jgi:serine-type D-Ala-D-Ala carboxypeptidase/endopeptidase (penicillin-binding protein 4)